MCTVPAYCFSLDGSRCQQLFQPHLPKMVGVCHKRKWHVLSGPVRPVCPVCCVCAAGAAGAVDPVQVTWTSQGLQGMKHLKATKKSTVPSNESHRVRFTVSQRGRRDWTRGDTAGRKAIHSTCSRNSLSPLTSPVGLEMGDDEGGGVLGSLMAQMSHRCVQQASNLRKCCEKQKFSDAAGNNAKNANLQKALYVRLMKLKNFKLHTSKPSFYNTFSSLRFSVSCRHSLALLHTKLVDLC